jgi:hypothetical protein
MKKLFYTTILTFVLLSCDNEDIQPRPDLITLLSGNQPTGKHWRMMSFKTTSNYFTFDINKFQTTESWYDYPESIKDNSTILFSDGEVQIDEGKIRYNDESPQIYIDKQFWTVNKKQDSVAIVDYVNLPSINSKWGITVSEHKIILTREDKDVGFKGSLLTQTVTFCALD